MSVWPVTRISAFLSASGECSNYAECLSSIEWHKASSGCGGIGSLYYFDCFHIFRVLTFNWINNHLFYCRCHNLKPSFCSATSPRAAAAERSSKVAAPMSPAVLTSVKQGTVASGARRADPAERKIREWVQPTLFNMWKYKRASCLVNPRADLKSSRDHSSWMLSRSTELLFLSIYHILNSILIFFESAYNSLN